MEDHLNDTVSDIQDLDESISDDELSLCDLPINDHEEEKEEKSHLHGASLFPDNSFEFEFVANPIHETGSTYKPEPNPENPKTHEFYRNLSNGLFLRREYSFKRSQSWRSESFKPPSVAAKRSPAAEGKCRRLPINGSYRKQNVLIGLVKFQPKMEMSEIRRRQSRQSPAKMFPATEGVEVTVAGNGNAEAVTQWGLLKPFRCRTHFLRALTKVLFR
ncbi:hypothetical protein FEM48_Zijuj03G0086900 [Ziziphus jujuba var. spinosa]|uniref:Uncharacterized protein n=1 Tax=Ziziphus jujuba var. spinosa TaxID=714518 RepID=A0A978VPB0_ZIZJJ|nr:hypothetical protein FEM48_Zijuj03G0086900 [Ziziphus jujuba var. spinosa]